MYTFLYLSPSNNDTLVLNQSLVVNNNTWRNTTINNLNIGFYKWQLKTNDTDGNTTSAFRWFEIRQNFNQSNFQFENLSGFSALTLDKNTGNLSIIGNATFNQNVNVVQNISVLGNASINGVLNMTNHNITGVNSIVFQNGFTIIQAP